MTLKALHALIATTECVPLEDAHDVAERLIARSKRPHPDEDDGDIEYDDYMSRDSSDEYTIAVVDLAQRIVAAKDFDGNEDRFHNLAVVYAKANYYKLTCGILERGLECFKGSIDLLADFLVYGIQCNKFEKCEQYFRILQEIPKYRWNWRAFEFSADYLLAKLSRLDKDVQIETISELCDCFIEHLPTEERAYLAKAVVLKAWGKSDEELDVLKRVTSQGSPARRAPMCAMRLAKHYFENGEYDNAIVMLKKAKSDNIEDQPSVNRGGLYILSCLCNYARFSKAYSENGRLQKEEEVLVHEIYEDFEVAKKHSIQGAMEDRKSVV